MKTLPVLALMITMATPNLLMGQAPPSQYKRMRAMLNKSYVHGLVEMGTDEKLFPAGSFLYGWNGATQQMHMWTFWNQLQMSGPVERTDNKISFTMQGSLADGRPMSGDVHHIIEGNTMTIQVRNRKQGDSSLPDIEYQVHRAPAANDAVPARSVGP